MLRLWISTALLLGAGVAIAQENGEPVFRAGTRLVEVNVVVRHKRLRPPGFNAKLRYWLDTGPPFGPAGDIITDLKQKDFTVLDNGVPQSISVFHAGPASDRPHMAIPPGAVSNRFDASGHPLENPTVILLDLLNTHFEYTEYARQGVRELLRTLEGTNTQIALYSLGEELHILHDFSDDPRQLDEISAVLNRRNTPTGALRRAMRDFGDIYELDGGEEVAADIHGRITTRAMRKIVQHLYGLPGRKSLIWVGQVQAIPPPMAAMLRAADIVVYPVMVRCPLGSPAPCGFDRLENADPSRGEGTPFGGRAFSDANDLIFALQAAREDAHSAYVLGYYPPEEMLDGKYHTITVKVNNMPSSTLELHYRAGYLATKKDMPPPPLLQDPVANPLAAGGIGLAAKAVPEPDRPNRYDVHLTIDLHDVSLQHVAGHSTGTLEFEMPDPSAKNRFLNGIVAVDVPDADLAKKMSGGFHLILEGAMPDMGEIHLVLRDRGTGAIGSLVVPARQTE